MSRRARHDCESKYLIASRIPSPYHTFKKFSKRNEARRVGFSIRQYLEIGVLSLIYHINNHSHEKQCIAYDPRPRSAFYPGHVEGGDQGCCRYRGRNERPHQSWLSTLAGVHAGFESTHSVGTETMPGRRLTLYYYFRSLQLLD